MRKIKVEANKYVVFDCETNGLKSKEDDLLSISFYKPDDEKSYTRFLPLEMAEDVKTTSINGITKSDLENKKPFSQEEFDWLINEFNLDTRIILTFSGRNFDERFLKNYMQRKGIEGFEKLQFHNFKTQIISSKYSGGNVTKDNLCNVFGIQNVKKVHSGENDCRLEWELFKRLDGFYYLITSGKKGDNVFRLSSDYIIPVSYLSTHPNLKRIKADIPYITCSSQVIKTFEISAQGISKFETNINGIIIENLINSMLKVERIDSSDFLLENKKKLCYVGQIPSSYDDVPMRFNLDGTVTSVREEDKNTEYEINDSLQLLRHRFTPLIDFIKEDIFNGTNIRSQELVINKENNILALCDLSNDDTVLEIKTNSSDPENYKEQLYYEAGGRKSYLLQMEWNNKRNSRHPQSIFFKILDVTVDVGEKPSSNWSDSQREHRRLTSVEKLKKNLEPYDVDVIEYVNTSQPIKLKCRICENEWEASYYEIYKKKVECPFCYTIVESLKKQKTVISDEEKNNLRACRYIVQIMQKSNNTICASGYTGAKMNVVAKCNKCGYVWSTRADYLLSHCYCPMCT